MADGLQEIMEIEKTSSRSRMCGRVGEDLVGQPVRVTGWVHRRRDLGSLIFIDLRDRTGILQISFGPDWNDEKTMDRARQIGHEDVLAVDGKVRHRPDGARNLDMLTGQIEVEVASFEILNGAETPAIPVYRTPEEELPSEELRLRHRVLDLRRTELRENLELRHHLTLAVRNYLNGLGFLEVETPILTKPTPEGARDYLVPSRVHPGEFYALPQSPQIYKQILMASGFDRYFQIARCFRDEDLRADRQPEFTQIDVEASFVSSEDILAWMEGLMVRLVEVAGFSHPGTFARMPHREAMERFGVDRPDLRYDLELRDFTAVLSDVEFGILASAVESGGRVRGLLLEGGARLSRKEVDVIEEAAKGTGAPGILRLKRTEEGGSGPLAKFLTEAHYEALGVGVGDLLLMAAGPDSVTSPALDATRGAAIEALGLEPVREHAWLWVTDFPLFEADDRSDTLTPGHHPFVQPHPEDMALLEDNPAAARGLAYDLVYNGTELGSGSIRIHNPELQRTVLRLLGLSDAEIGRKFGFLLEALGSGAPPHGGVAFGMDRIVQSLAGATSLREVIAFPKTTAARALFEGAPAAVSDEELEGLHLEVVLETASGEPSVIPQD